MAIGSEWSNGTLAGACMKMPGFSANPAHAPNH
jgi:hypothetical protein